MVEKHVGTGSQYLWTPRDASGAFLDGAKRYRLHVPSNIPVKNFWSVVAYDAGSRSILRSGQPFPSVSSYTGPSRMPTARSISTSRPKRRPVPEAPPGTGSKPRPAKAGSRCSAFTVRSRRSSIRAGSQTTRRGEVVAILDVRSRIVTFRSLLAT